MRFLPHFPAQIQNKWQGKGSKVWLIDKTFAQVKGEWCYLYRGSNGDRNLADVDLSKTHNMAKIKAFFTQNIGLYEDSPKFYESSITITLVFTIANKLLLRRMEARS
ncbi:MAG: DDE-type integrase/transposase/recombinase [Cyanobacteria bacterium P01_F01_bin.53]